MKRSKLVVSMLTIAVSAALIGGATMAALSDSETINNNTFAAGTLDLTIGGEVSNANFDVKNMKPGDQPKKTFTLNNIGSINGYLNINSVSVTNLENGITEPESEAGDTTTNVGELGDVVNIRLFVDKDGDGYIDTNESTFYNGKVSNLPTSFKFDQLISAGGNTKITVLLDWWDTDNDNKAQNDSMDIDFSFNLTQRPQIVAPATISAVEPAVDEVVVPALDEVVAPTENN